MICALCAASDRTTRLEMQQHGVRFASHKMLSANRRNVCDHVPKTTCLYSHVRDVQSEVGFEEVCRSRAHKNSRAMAIYTCNLKSEVIKSPFQACSDFAMAQGGKRHVAEAWAVCIPKQPLAVPSGFHSPSAAPPRHCCMQEPCWVCISSSEMAAETPAVISNHAW